MEKRHLIDEKMLPNENLEYRIDRVEAILKSNNAHEPTCPIRIIEVANRQGGLHYSTTESCNCWLSTKKDDPKDGLPMKNVT